MLALDKAKVFALVATPMVVAIVGAAVTYYTKGDEVSLEYVRLATDILRSDPKPDDPKEKALRGWAVDLLNDHSTVNIEGDAREALIGRSLPAAPQKTSDMRSGGWGPIKYSPDGGPIQFKISIGQAQFGEYVFSLKDSEGQRQITGEGDNIDEFPDQFEVPADTDLDGKIIHWQVIVQAIGAIEEGQQLYYVAITIVQDGKIIENGSITYQGRLDGFKNIFGFMRFQAT